MKRVLAVLFLPFLFACFGSAAAPPTAAPATADPPLPPCRDAPELVLVDLPHDTPSNRICLGYDGTLRLAPVGRTCDDYGYLTNQNEPPARIALIGATPPPSSSGCVVRPSHVVQGAAGGYPSAYSSGGSGGGSGSVYVHGYTRSNGTYVHGYTRSR